MRHVHRGIAMGADLDLEWQYAGVDGAVSTVTQPLGATVLAAAKEGVDGCDHGAWDAWLGGEVVPCDVRMEKRFIISPEPGEGKVPE